MSLCPGTRAGANVPGQTPLSRPVPGQNNLPKRTKKQEKDIPKQEKDVLKQRVLYRDICSCPCPGTKGHRDNIFFCPGTKGQRNVPSRFVPGRPVPWKPYFKVNFQCQKLPEPFSIFDTSPLTQFSKFNNFLWVCWFLGKNLSNFGPPVWKLHNPYCHTFPHRFSVTWQAVSCNPKIYNIICWFTGLLGQMTRLPRVLCSKNYFLS